MTRKKLDLRQDSKLVGLCHDLNGLDYTPLVAVFAWTGLASLPILETATSLPRKTIERTLNVLLKHNAISERALSSSLLKARGRGSPLYGLEDLGAALLRDTQLKPNAQPCKLNHPAELAHAASLTTLAARAQADQLTFAVEAPLAFEDEQVRFDLRLTSTRPHSVVEVEQHADAHHLPRLLDKLRRLARFFAAPHARDISTDVRVIFNITRTQWDITRRTWLRATATVASELGGTLPFKVWGCLFTDFIKTFDWRSTQGFELLFDPSLLPQFGAAPANPTAPDTALTAPLTLDTVLPAELRSYRAALLHDDYVLLNAYRHLFDAELETYQAASPVSFIRLVELIYTASHHPNRSVAARTGLPLASLFLLRNYLDQPNRADLKQALCAALKTFHTARHSGINMLRHEFTHLCWDVVLRYHGLARGGALQVTVELPDDQRSELHVTVNLTNDLVTGEDGVLPADEPQLARQALAWFLEACVLYADLLGLDVKK